MQTPQQNSSRKLLKEQEVADWTGTSVRTLQTYRVRGGGPEFIKLGSNVRYRPEDVEAWIECGRRAHTSEAAQ